MRKQALKKPAQLVGTVLTASLLSSGPINGSDNVPKLVRTTSPIRVAQAPTHSFETERDQAAKTLFPETSSNEVQSSGIPFALPDMADQGRTPSAELNRKASDQTLETLLTPDRVVSLNQHHVGSMGSDAASTRINQFVETRVVEDLESETKEALKPYVSVPSATIPSRPTASRKSSQLGTVQSNPLVVDSPPQLRRFNANEPMIPPSSIPSGLLEELESETGLRLAQNPHPGSSSMHGFQEASDALSIKNDTTVRTRKSARNSGFGMLAIDQIGQHLEDNNETETPSAILTGQRFPNDRVALSPKPRNNSTTNSQVAKEDSSASPESLREHLLQSTAGDLQDEKLPRLPVPKPAQAESDIPKIGMRRDDEPVYEPLPSPYRPSQTDTRVPREVDELVQSARSNTQVGERAKQLELTDKPTLSKRLSDWANGFRPKKPDTTRSLERQTQNPAARPANESRNSARGGLFNRLFRK